MDSSSKERLTGALILVAVLVIIVPEMLSGPRHTSADALATAARAADAGPPLTTYSVTLGGPVDQQSVQQSPLAPAVTESPVESAAFPSAQTMQDSTGEAAAAPAASSTPKAASASAAAGMWWAQLGSFASRENAQRLASKLTAAGFAMEVTKVKSGVKDLYRVRAGPVHDRGEAIALQSRLEAAGSKSSLVAP